MSFGRRLAYESLRKTNPAGQGARGWMQRIKISMTITVVDN